MILIFSNSNFPPRSYPKSKPILFLDQVHSTVGNRVEKIPGGDSSKFSFSFFCLTVNTPTKKKPQHKTPCCSLVFLYRPAKSKHWGIVNLFWLRHGQLWKQISRLLFGFC